MTAQDRTLDQYHELMQLNAVSHIIRAARQLGIFAELSQGQRTAEQLCDELSLEPHAAALLLDALLAVGIVQKYGDDHALAPAAQLLCQYDSDLGDRRWVRLAQEVRRKPDNQADRDHEADRGDIPSDGEIPSDAGSETDGATGCDPGLRERDHFNSIAATQWVHTPAAMQAAEILDLGGEDELSGLDILDLGCGAAVWSCAMAHRDRRATVTAADHAAALEAAQSTAEAIEIGDRFHTLVGEPEQLPLPGARYDLVLLPQRLHALDDARADRWVARATAAAAAGGRVIVIDLFRGPAKPNLAESVEALKLQLETPAGRMRPLEETQQRLQAAGLEKIQFSFLAASRLNLGMMVGVKPLE